MAKTKVILPVLLLCVLCTAASAREISWRRYSMDGSRDHSKGTALKEQKLLDSYAPRMAHLKRVVGTCPEPLTKRGAESTMGNWVADAFRSELSIITGDKIDVVVYNFGGIRSDMPLGDVVEDDIRGMFPFKNSPCLVKIYGKRLIEIAGELCRSPQAISGMEIVSRDRALESLKVDGKPVDPEAVYTLATIDFLLTGGDGFFLGKDAIETKVANTLAFDVFMSHLKRLQDAGKPIAAVRDGRFRIEGDFMRKGHRDAAPADMASGLPDGTVAENASRHRLTIVHTNDLHSQLEPMRSGRDAGKGGACEIAAFVDSLRKADGRSNVLLLDAGDFEQGTSYFTLFGGETEIKSMNLLDYDACTVGNHEWDNGDAALASRLRKARCKCLLANYKWGNKDLDKVLEPYAIIRRGGLKIGLIGVLDDVSSLVAKNNVVSLEYESPEIAVNRWSTFLKKEKRCDVVIVLSHCGYSTVQGPVGDIQMASMIRDVDIIIGGHSHTNLKAPTYVKDLDGRDVMIVTDYCKGVYAGVIKISD